jgi:hypothetical protein
MKATLITLPASAANRSGAAGRHTANTTIRLTSMTRT